VAVFRPQASEQEAARWGLTVEEASPPFLVLPDCWESVLTFESVSTQWLRAGMAGVPCGLNYEVLPFAFRMRGIRQADHPRVFTDLRLMEDAALSYFAKKR
jgi:hypothetical protein